MRHVSGLALAAGSALLLSVVCAWAEPSAAKGQALFAKIGCYSCHGYQGQGGAAGPRIGLTQLPLEGVSAFIRNSAGEMPPYSTKVLSEADLADIYAYLQSVPHPPDVKSIPLLNQ